MEAVAEAADQTHTVPLASTSSSLYLASPLVDYALIGGLSVAIFCVWWFVPHAARPTAAAIAASQLLSYGINFPHFSATAFRLYHSRRNLAQYPTTAFGIPLILVAVCGLALRSPGSFGIYLVKMMMLWSPYHYCGQALGISILYARRAGLRIERWERWALSGTIFSLYLALQAKGELDENVYFGVTIPYTGMPSWVGKVALVICAASTLALLVAVVSWVRRTGKMIPPIIVLPTLSLFVWFALGHYNTSYLMFIPAFHGAQYLFIAWAMQLREKTLASGVRASMRFFVVESARWGAINVALGAGLFVGLPALVGRFVALDSEYTKGIVLAAVQIHHFFVDGVIWKLKSATVSRPLTSTLTELVRAS